MKSLRAAAIATLALFLAGAVHAGAKKQSAVAIRFHAEGGTEGADFSQPIELINPRRKTNMQSMPLVSEREIKAFYPFQARDNSGTFGASFKLDSHGTNLLAEHTMSRRGSYILAFFNGRHVIDLYVDRGVTDGIISIPSGLTRNDLTLLEITFPLIGQENVKPGKKKNPANEKPTPLPKAADMPRMQPAVVRQPDGSVVPATAAPGSASDAGTIVPRPVSPIGQ
ncbi:MAG: hypothetical protein PHC88_15975 [Terrimicrobiaceae bacterium]|nr:hypothetical protein [Terrimicrobiaceae bacterium]